MNSATMRAFAFAAALIVTGSAARAEPVYVISTADGPFAPSFRGEANTTYFGWSRGTWDGNPADDTPAGEVINPTPSINPAGLGGVNLVRSAASIAAYPDIISSTNNIYTGPVTIDMTLTIPTLGVVGTGFTTIIIQGNSLPSAGDPRGILDVFSFGTIAGVSPEYVRYGNTELETQFWAKWVIPGNAASYDVHIDSTGPAAISGIFSMSDMVVDTYWSPTGYAGDTATALPVPEPSSVVMASLGAVGVGAWTRSRRRTRGRRP